MKRTNQTGEDQTPASNPGAGRDTLSHWLLLAHILRPQGRRGEVLAGLFTDFPERFDESPRVFLAKPDFSGTPEQARAIQVRGFFLPVGKNVGRIVLSLEGIDSITAAETLAGLDILIPQEERREPEEDASYISDLIGCSVYDVPPGHPPDTPPDPATLVGAIDDVHFPTSPDGTRRLAEAAPLLAVLSPTGDEILIPYVHAYLIAQQMDERRILMALPVGLTDVNS